MTNSKYILRHHTIARFFRVSLETNRFGKGFRLMIQFGNSRKPYSMGAGYRAWDLPWHSMSVHSPWYRKRAWFSYVPGITLTLGTRHRYGSKPVRFTARMTTKGNSKLVVPAWW